MASDHHDAPVGGALRHTPNGRGHAYRPSLDQRIPVLPTDDDPIELRVLVADGAHRVTVDVRVDADAVQTVPTTPLTSGEPHGIDGGEDGHLAAAAAAGEQVEGMHPEAATIGPFPAGTDLHYRFASPDHTTDWSDVTIAHWQPVPDPALDLTGDTTERLVPGSVEQLTAGNDVRRVRFALHLDDDEHVLGLGERFHALDHRDHDIDTVVFEQYKQQGERTYLPVPFALVVGGDTAWGVHIDTTRRCFFDIATSHADQLIVEALIDPADPAITAATWTGTPPEVLDAFTAATGRPAPVPRWTFRPWASGNEWNTQQRVQAEIQRSLDEDIPVGVVVIEAWSDEATFTIFRDADYTPTTDGSPHTLDDFTFPADGAWPDPAGLVDWLHHHDVKVLLWQIPLLPIDVPDDRHGAAQLAHDRHALIDGNHAVLEADHTPYHNRGWWFPGALMPDFTSAETRRWWTDKRRYLVDEVGIDGFKTDGGEHAWGDELRYADDTRGDQTNNRYPNLYARAYHDLLDDTDTDGITFSRAGWTGAGTTPCHWAGDEDSTWEAFRASILAGLSAGVSGVSAWGFDHGGFSGPIPDPELYLRTTAMATLAPIMQYHAEFNHHRPPNRDRTPWNIAQRHDAPHVLDIYRRFATIRDRLVDYLHDQYHTGATTGLPLMRTLALHWPRDPAIWNHPYQYMLGDHLLVAPVTEPGVDTTSVYLPPGNWIDAWTGEPHTGQTTLAVPTPLDRIPVFTTDTSQGKSVSALFQAGN